MHYRYMDSKMSNHLFGVSQSGIQVKREGLVIWAGAY